MSKQTGVEVILVGESGNAFAVMGATTKAMRRAKIDKEIIDAYIKEPMAGDYDNLLRVTMDYVEVQ